METWTRPDGRWYCMELCRDLYGPAVVVYYGGALTSRLRIVPVASTVEGEKMLDQLATRRQQHGYRRAAG